MPIVEEPQPRPKRNPRVLNKAEAAARRVQNKRAHAMGLSGQIIATRVTSSNKSTMEALKKLPDSLRDRAVRLSTYAAAAVVRKKANEYLKVINSAREPDEGEFPGASEKTETFYKKSKAQQAKLAGKKSMVKSVSIKQKQYDRGATQLAMVGPRRKKNDTERGGSQAWILENGGVIELWGTGRYYHLKPRPFLEPAGKRTLRKQQAAYIKRTRRLWRDS